MPHQLVTNNQTDLYPKYRIIIIGAHDTNVIWVKTIIIYTDVHASKTLEIPFRKF